VVSITFLGHCNRGAAPGMNTSPPEVSPPADTGLRFPGSGVPGEELTQQQADIIGQCVTGPIVWEVCFQGSHDVELQLVADMTGRGNIAIDRNRGSMVAGTWFIFTPDRNPPPATQPPRPQRPPLLED
jgi:hypothetical protein